MAAITVQCADFHLAAVASLVIPAGNVNARPVNVLTAQFVIVRHVAVLKLEVTVESVDVRRVNAALVQYVPAYHVVAPKKAAVKCVHARLANVNIVPIARMHHAAVLERPAVKSALADPVVVRSCAKSAAVRHAAVNLASLVTRVHAVNQAVQKGNRAYPALKMA